MYIHTHMYDYLCISTYRWIMIDYWIDLFHPMSPRIPCFVRIDLQGGEIPVGQLRPDFATVVASTFRKQSRWMKDVRNSSVYELYVLLNCYCHFIHSKNRLVYSYPKNIVPWAPINMRLKPFLKCDSNTVCEDQISCVYGGWLRTPTPVDRWVIPLFQGFLQYQVVQDFATIHSMDPIL